MKKLLVVSLVVLLLIISGCTADTNSDSELSNSPSPAVESDTPGNSEVPESIAPSATLEPKIIFDHNLVGKTNEEAIELLNTYEIKYIATEEYSEDHDTSMVLSQSIEPGSEIEKDTIITLTVSKGSEYVVVPNLVAMTKEEASEFLENKLLLVEIEEINHDTVKENLVISQDIEPSTKIKIGETVAVTISLGPVQIQVIDLLNHTESYVNAFFAEVALECAISYEQSNTVEAGKVISQGVSGNQYANEGDTISVVISQGMVEFVLENYTGKALSEVTSLLSGKCIVETRLEYNSEYSDRSVIGQSLEAGTSVNMNSRILLTVNNWDDKPVSFADAGLEQLVRDKINKSSGALTYTDVKDIMNLSNYSTDHDKIRSLEGIEVLTSLKSLYLFGENITDITPLAGLTELMSLNIELNNIPDITPLAGLVNMENFSLSGNPITDISIMANMPNLESVSLSGCPINSISVISDYTNIDFLNISHTFVPGQEVKDIVTNFTKLRALHMTKIDVGNLDFLNCFDTLTYLSADFCELDNIDCLVNFPYMKSLRIYHNEIEDITPLQNLTYLESLYIGFNDIHDISALENLTSIDYLFITDIPANDFSVLANLTELEKLYISMNRIDNVEFLRPLDRLEVLEMNSDITDKTNYVEIINEHKARGCDVSTK